MDFHKNVVHSNTSQSQNNESAERYKNTVRQRMMLTHNQEVKQFRVKVYCGCKTPSSLNKNFKLTTFFCICINHADKCA